MKAVLYIAWRYAFSKNQQNAINIINAISGLVLVTGSAALLIVLAAFAGLKQVSLSFVNAANPDMKVQPVMGKTFDMIPSQLLQLDSIEGVAAYTQVLEDRAYINFKNKNTIAYIKGVDSHYAEVTGIDKNISLGHWYIDEYRCVVGNGISKALGLGLFDTENFLKIVVPRPGTESITRGRQLPYNQMFFTPSGIYGINEDFDKKYIFTELAKVRTLFNLGKQTISAVELRLHPDAVETDVKKALIGIFGNNFTIRNRVEQNVSLYKMLRTENLAIYAIFVLVLIVALFNLIGALIMMILEKKKNMWTLRSLGMQVHELRLIFFSQGMIVTMVSSVLGIVLGLLICWGQMTFGWLQIGYGMSYPIDVVFGDVLLVLFTIFVLGVLASWMASSRLNKQLLETV